MPMFKAQDVQKAFKAIRHGIPPGFGKSRKWDIVEPATGDLFPPKAILFLAKQFAGDDSRSGGGGDVGTNNALRERGFRVILKPEFEESKEGEDVQEILDSGNDATTKRQLINARLGQGGFRAELIELWEGKCALTQVDVQPVLRASHIKSWRDSNDNERLDPANGFLLVANADALFDRHLISFDDQGRVLACPTIDRTALEKIGLQTGKHIDLKPQNIAYLQWHRSEFEKLRGAGYLF
jgi:putative restriction endonuclease